MAKNRLPKKLKKAIKKTYDNLLSEKNVPRKLRVKQVQFLYKETLTYELAEMLEDSCVASGSNSEAVALGLKPYHDPLLLRTDGSFSLN